MKKTALILALAIAMPAWAQADKEAKPAQAPAAPKAAEQPQQKAAEPPAASQEADKSAGAEAPKKPARKHSRRMEDARHCLDEPTNTAIIKCAEAYL